MSEIHDLRERAKELRCLYRVNEAAADRSQAPTVTFLRVLEIIPQGWQRPNSTGARIEYLGRSYVGPGYASGGQVLWEPLSLWGTEVGRIEVTDCAPVGDEQPFLPEERELLKSIATRLGEYLEWKHTQLMSERLPTTGAHWSWRQKYADALAAALDAERFGVSRLWIGGSTESGAAGPGSDIDLYIEFRGTEPQRKELSCWLEGWSMCLAELNFQQTGYRDSDGLLDVHWIDAAADPRAPHAWRELPLGTPNRP